MKPPPLTSSAGDSPVRTSASLVPALESTGRSQGSGPSTLASFAFFDRASCSWKTSQRSLFEGSTVFSGTWPRSGSMRNGMCFERPMSGPRIVESDSSSWPTPTASEYGSSQNGINGVGGEHERPSAGTPSLWTLARNWPTPTARLGDEKRGTPSQELARRRFASGRRNLDDAAALWPTPLAADAGKGGNKYVGGNLTLLGAARLKTEWPTPQARDAKGRSSENHPDRGGPNLPNLVSEMWPTPTAHDALTPKTPEQVAAMRARAPKRKGGGSPGVSNLNETVAALWPTPTAMDANSSGGRNKSAAKPGSKTHAGTSLYRRRDHTDSHRARARSPDGMVLNPRFVEAMMGFPDGHTDCAYSETPSSPSKRRSRSKS